jgi:NHLM bacteriocin system ABC transporter peptidase/ATP-binding protein
MQPDAAAITPPPGAPPKPRSTARVRTPTVLQMEAVECGAAALCIVMSHYGKVVPLEELRSACGVSRDGSKAANVVRAARSYGFDAKGYRREPEELRTMKLPLIVFWNFNHFLVVEGFAKGKVFLNDPASGPRTVTDQEFDESFTGVALVIEPSATFQPSGQRSTIWSGLKTRLPLRDSALLYLLLAGLALVVPGLLLPVFTKLFIDNYLVARMDSWVKPLLFGLLLTAIVRGCLTWLQHYCLIRFRARLALDMSGRFFWHVLRLPLGFYAQRSAGDIATRVATNERVASLMTGELATTVLNVIMVVFFAALMLTYDPVLTLVGVCIAVINVIFLRAVSRHRKDGMQRLANDGGKLMATSMGGLQMMETLKASGLEADFFSKWSGTQAKVMNGQQSMGATDVFLHGVPPLLTMLNTVAILSLGGLRVMDGVMTIGMLVAFQSLMSSFIDPINQLVGMGAQLQQVEGDMNRLDDVLKNQPEPQTANIGREAPAEDLQRLKGFVELRNVTFAYSPLDAPLLRDFNLALRPGTRVALVGPSGCGKSTIARLVMGLYQPSSGEVLFDGRTREQHARQSVLSSLAMVSQEISLFDGTVRDNLTMWDDTVPEGQVVRAAKDACIHEAIAVRPRGYDSAVQEGGVNFSGGQRQRLEIARALAGDPRILVLDEATSALDPMTEMAVDDNIRQRGCTCLIVAHRLSAIRDCDEIIVLERGKVKQRGTHTELMAEGGLYGSLMQDQ